MAFGVAGVAGLALAARVTWWFLPLGLLCGLAGWAYTGGPRPYGYLGSRRALRLRVLRAGRDRGLGLRAAVRSRSPVAGYLFAYAFDWGFALWAGVPVGLLAAALLEANNLRDIDTDAEAGKKTLAVRLGRQGAGVLYVGTLVAAARRHRASLHSYRAWALLALAAVPLAIVPFGWRWSDKKGRELLPMLGGTARLQLVRRSPADPRVAAVSTSQSGSAQRRSQ